jgi:acyl carrier protein
MALDRLESFAVLRDVVAEVLAIDADQVLEDAKFREDLDADSLDLVEIVMLLEDRLGISLPGQGLREIATVGQALDLWMAHAQASS